MKVGRGWFARFGWIAVSAAVGAALGLAITREPPPRHAFLKGARRIEAPEAARKDVEEFRSSRHLYIVQDEPGKVAERVREELTGAVQQGQPQEFVAFIVPRTEGTRIRYTFPPRETVIIGPSSSTPGTLVEVRTYRSPNPIESLITRLRRTLPI